MATSKATRFFTGFMALLFLGTSSALLIALIVQGVQNHKKSDGAASTPASQTQPAKGNKLEGTKLANYTPVPKVDKLQVIDITPGTGNEVKSGDKITFDYTGALATDGTIFQSSLDTGQPITYPLSQLIPGWQQGIPGMKEGGTRRLLIPSALGYGAQAQQGIPANSDLVFDITLKKID